MLVALALTACFQGQSRRAAASETQTRTIDSSSAAGAVAAAGESAVIAMGMSDQLLPDHTKSSSASGVSPVEFGIPAVR